MAEKHEQPTRNPQQQQMFSNLIASNPKKEGGGAASTFVSAVLHVGLIVLAVYATSRVREVVAESDATNILIPIEEEEPPPPPPPPPPPANTPPPPEITEVPKGFQTLTVPTVIPPDIPPPTAGPEISESDFTGEGVEGGRATGNANVKVTAENIEAAPVFTPYTVKPELKNRDAVQRALVRNYPPLLRDAGIGGTVLLWALIDETGNVTKSQVKEGSGHDALDQAAMKVADIMAFTPALNRDQKVKVWIQLPIVFKTQ
ncbi:MAG TPA: TonB family protein [Longimicrobiales bacterium]|nr:TonB family protein [Longimicrobiales bacterium]